MLALRIQNVSKRFVYPGGNSVEALRDVSVNIQPSEFVMIVGANGSGKSTFLNVIAGQMVPDSGAIYATVDKRERNWSTASARSRGRLVARVHQDPRAGSVDDLSVLENLRLSTFAGLPSPLLPSLFGTRKRQLQGIIAQTPLSDKGAALAGELSQGQRQLLALEMAAGRNVKLFLLDEHTASLDRANAAATMVRTEQLCSALGATTLMITHDLLIAKQYGNRLLVFQDGRIASDIQGSDKRALTVADIARLSGFAEDPK